MHAESHLWPIYLIADARESRRQRREISFEIIDRAEIADMARLIMTRLDEPAITAHIGTESPCFRSRIEGEGLYWVRRLATDAASEGGVTLRPSGGVSVTGSVIRQTA